MLNLRVIDFESHFQGAVFDELNSHQSLIASAVEAANVVVIGDVLSRASHISGAFAVNS